MFQFTDGPGWSLPLDLTQRVYWVWEVRHSPQGAGRRLADVGWANTTEITTNLIGVKLIAELEGVSLFTWYGGCPSALSTPEACMQYAIANHRYHDEPVLCIWNPLVGANGDVEEWCVGSSSNTPEEWFTTNWLPSAGDLGRTETGIAGICGPWGGMCLPVQCPEHPNTWPQFEYESVGANDLEGTALVFRWENGVTSASTSSNTWTEFGCESETVRVAVQDTGGGMDVTAAFMH